MNHKKNLNAMMLRALRLIALLSGGIQANAQPIYSTSIFDDATRLPITPFSLTLKQPLYRDTADYKFHGKKYLPWFRMPNPACFSLGISTAPRILYRPFATLPEEFDYYNPSFKNQYTASPKYYEASGIDYLNQKTRTRLDVFLPLQKAKPIGWQVMDALLNTALQGYSTRNQRLNISN